MKTNILLLAASFVAISAIAQETGAEGSQESQGNPIQQEEGTKIKNSDVFGEKNDQYPETSSFTLDANDAVLEEKVVSKKQEIKRRETPKETSRHDNRHGHEQMQTLGGRNSHHGGFGALSFRASEFNNKDIILAGIRAGWIINRAIAIGFEGHGVIPTAEYENIDPNLGLRSRLVGGYGGLFLEPIILSNKLVHLTFPVAGGAGWLGYIVDWEQNRHYYFHDLIDDDVFWYIEPGAAIELNVARNFRINMGATYRFTENLELISTSSSAFEAWNYFLTLKFGRF
jgi:hypothetical protein